MHIEVNPATDYTLPAPHVLDMQITVNATASDVVIRTRAAGAALCRVPKGEAWTFETVEVGSKYSAEGNELVWKRVKLGTLPDSEAALIERVRAKMAATYDDPKATIAAPVPKPMLKVRSEELCQCGEYMEGHPNVLESGHNPTPWPRPEMETAHTADLDALAADYFGLSRRDGETDEALRNRLKIAAYPKTEPNIAAS